MTEERYKKFKEIIEKKGYTLYNARGTISNEHFYYYKGFSHSNDDNGNEIPSYQIIFLVWNFREGIHIPDFDAWGVSPLILTESCEWPRIDLELTTHDFDVDKVEQFAYDFYFKFLVTHGL